ncbi:hypothetical protein AYI69_g297 [Smittium culicis]|uniref:Uncharacterized protein n=1 Tax=Smittium culicis TaxID=133412 RepID=A0A1R1YTQ6_9FUNG|nr:hypothetical protein AYI69_g297 [Smittium culicis]
MNRYPVSAEVERTKQSLSPIMSVSLFTLSFICTIGNESWMSDLLHNIATGIPSRSFVFISISIQIQFYFSQK